METLPTNSPTINNSSQWELLQRQCTAFLNSGFLPESITHEGTGANKKPINFEKAMAKAITIAMKGRELGIPPLQAFSSIAVIKGKPCLSAELMLALIYQRNPGAKVSFVTPHEKQGVECTVSMKRIDGDEQRFSFTREDAKAAGLLVPSRSGEPTAWQKYPKAMLRARAISAGARAVFPDAIMGCYTKEELGGEVNEEEFYEAEVAAFEDKQSIQGSGAEFSNGGKGETERNKNLGVNGGEGYKNVATARWDTEKATPNQIKRLYAIGGEVLKLKGDPLHSALKELAKKTADVEHLEDLTKTKIQTVYQQLLGQTL